MNPYLGNSFQLSGVERYRLEGGKAEGIEVLHAKNGNGIDLYLSLSRAGDIMALTYRGIMLNYLTPNGYVHPSYYDPHGSGWIKAFAAGFLTTCGLENVGSPCQDKGEELPLHGSLSMIPVSSYSWEENEEEIILKTVLEDEAIFSRKIERIRRIHLSKKSPEFTVVDSLENRGGEAVDFECLYHLNFGYPLLQETSEIYIASEKVEARNAHAEEHLKEWKTITSPEPAYEECCYYHTLKEGKAGLFNPDLGFGVSLSFDPKILDHFTEWKLLGGSRLRLGP